MELVAGKVSVEASKQSGDFDSLEENLEKIVKEARAIRPFPTPPKLYKIGEVVQFSGFSRQTIHNYTAMGLINESKWTVAGHRLYDEDVFHRLAIIKKLKERYPLSLIKKVLDRIY